jgi:hypothetical protein
MSETVIVRGMKEEWFMDHFKDMAVYFGGDPRGIPAKDARFIGFYLEAPVSAITHIGIVRNIERTENETTFHLRAIIKLDQPIKTIDEHAIRKQEYWTLHELGIQQIALIINSFAIASA